MSEKEKPEALPSFTTLSCDAASSGISFAIVSTSAKEIEFLNEAFAFLFNGLREAKCRFEKGKDGRDGVIEAVEVVTKFLLRFPGVTDDGLYAPLAALQSALMNLDDRKVLPLLEPARRHQGGRPRASALRECDKGAATFTVSRLVATGLPKDKALEKVARVLCKAGVKPGRGSKVITDRTVRGWCEEVAADIGRHSEVAQTFDDLGKGRPAIEGADISVIRQDSLERLRMVLLATRAADR